MYVPLFLFQFIITDMAKENKLDGPKMVASAIIGLDVRNIIVNDKTYVISPPSIARIAGATFWLSEMKDGTNMRELFKNFSNSKNLTRALSWFIQGNDELSDELAEGTLDEIVEALVIACSLIDAENFMKLSVLRRSVRRLVAKQK